jgi:hypothetical protein
MTWAPLLLADPSPVLRLRVLCDLLGRSAQDPEVQELTRLRQADPLAARLLNLQSSDGSWQVGLTGDTAAIPGIYATALALMRLGYLGFGAEHPAVRAGAAYLFSQQRVDGAWPQPAEDEDEEAGALRAPSALPPEREGYSMRPLQASLPLRGLAACGFAQDPRAERAYEWLLAQRLPDGAWPTGIASGAYGRVAGYRKLPHSRWGCRANTTGALLCFAFHPTRCTSPEALRALDLLLGRETREASLVGFETARLVGAEPARGFTTFYARFDLAQLLDLCWRVGADREDERVAALTQFILSLQGPYGLWPYAPRPQLARWLTFDLLRSFSHLSAAGEKESAWLSLEPRTPFQAYPKKAIRY